MQKKELQAEKGEYVLLENGQLVQVAAKKPHKNMDSQEVTDVLGEGYIFSNTKSMSLNKKDFEDLIVSEEIPEYKEGQTPKKYSSKSYADLYFNKNTQTPAETARIVHKKHKVITDEGQKYNPFIQKANELNIENRTPYLEILKEVSETIKPYAEQEDSNSLEVVQQFKFGGNTGSKFFVDKKKSNSNTPEYYMKGGKLVSSYQSGGDIFGGLASGAAAGSVFGPIGTGVGALIGGIGSIFTGKSAAKDKKRALAEQAAYIAEQKRLSGEMTNASMLGTAGQALIPNHINERADYSHLNSRINETYDNINRTYDTSTANMQANATAQGNSTLRNLAPHLSGAQLQNMGANIVGQNFKVSNDIGSQRLDNKNRFAIDRAQKLNTLDLREADINRDYTNAEGYAEVDKSRRIIGDFTNNKIDGLSRDSQISTNDYSTKRAVELGQAAQAQAAQGRFNNTLLQAGQVGQVANSVINTRSSGNPLQGTEANNPSGYNQNNPNFSSAPDMLDLNDPLIQTGEQPTVGHRKHPTTGVIYKRDPYAGGWVKVK